MIAVLIDAFITCFFDGKNLKKLESWLVHRSIAIAGVAIALAFWATVQNANVLGLIITILFFFASLLIEYATKDEPFLVNKNAISIPALLIWLTLSLPGIFGIAYGILYAKGFFV